MNRDLHHEERRVALVLLHRQSLGSSDEDENTLFMDVKVAGPTIKADSKPCQVSEYWAQGDHSERPAAGEEMERWRGNLKGFSSLLPTRPYFPGALTERDPFLPSCIPLTLPDLRPGLPIS
ncbi:MAG: hypothetical protein C4293_05440 [Nitrospiraceae bacterium]